jgi:hypothetical protein
MTKFPIGKSMVLRMAIPRRRNARKLRAAATGDRVACYWHDCEATQQSVDVPGLPPAVRALQHLAKHEIADNDLIDAEDRTQSPDMGRIPAIENLRWPAHAAKAISASRP